MASMQDEFFQARRFTVKGSFVVERKITVELQRITERISDAVGKNKIRSLVLLGGYGRGEGGVMMQDGEERPHNNYDLLLVVKSKNKVGYAQAALQGAMDGILQETQAGVDISVLSAPALKRMPCRLIWYDMRKGHRTLAGDARFIPSLGRFKKRNIPDWDIRNLLVNRATLLVINDLLLEAGEPTDPKIRRLIVKHAMKGIIGYGDALLFFLGAYHWSYVEKAERMATRSDIDEGFKALYAMAAAFRFQPDYEAFETKALKAWNESLKVQLEQIHLMVERFRCKRAELDWRSYPEIALKHALWEDPLSVKRWAKKGLNFARNRGDESAFDVVTTLGLQSLSKKERLPLLHPAIAYSGAPEAYRQLAKRWLKALNTTKESLRRAYLKAWERYGDVHFVEVVRKYGIDLNEERER